MTYLVKRIGLCAVLLSTTATGVAFSQGTFGAALQRKYDIMQQQADTDRQRAEAERVRADAERAQIEAQSRSMSAGCHGSQGYQGGQSGGVVRMVGEGDLEPIGLGVLHFSSNEGALDISATRRLAEQGDVIARLRLGMSYMDGIGVQENAQEAVKWLLPLADNGLKQAQFAMGLLFYPGHYEDVSGNLGVDAATGAKDGDLQKNVIQSERWFRLAAEQGMAEAQYNLAVLHDAGFSENHNYAEAFKWYKLASAQGVAPAQLNLSRLYILGRGVPRNYKNAYVWALMAFKQDGLAVQFAEQTGGLAREHLSATQLQSARAAASRCLTSNYKSCD